MALSIVDLLSSDLTSFGLARSGLALPYRSGLVWSGPPRCFTLPPRPAKKIHPQSQSIQSRHPKMETSQPSPSPSSVNYVLGFLMVGLAWGLTTPFIRRAAKDHRPPPHPLLEREDVRNSLVRSRLYGTVFAVADLLRNPRYAVPLVLNLTGSVWFFLLIGKAGRLCSTPPIRWGRERVANREDKLELSLTVPIVNTLAFLFTVIGEWWVDNKIISRGWFPFDTWPLFWVC